VLVARKSREQPRSRLSAADLANACQPEWALANAAWALAKKFVQEKECLSHGTKKFVQEKECLSHGTTKTNLKSNIFKLNMVLINIIRSQLKALQT
jgi:hypothetical protein